MHVAIQKQYFTKNLKGKTLNKIPREALPHFEIMDGQKETVVEGIIIESARVKLDGSSSKNAQLDGSKIMRGNGSRNGR